MVDASDLQPVLASERRRGSSIVIESLAAV
jgi:hypothetical protein